MPGQVVHEVVERRQPAGGGVLQHRVEPALGLAREHRDAELPAGIELDRLPVEHRQASGDVEAAHRDRDAGIAERAGDVERARILVRLDADQRDQAEIAVAPEPREQRRDVDPGVGLVDDRDVDVDVRSEHLAFGAIGRNAIDGRERIGRDHRAPPADHIAVFVVVRRLDQDELEAPLSDRLRSRPESVPAWRCPATMARGMDTRAGTPPQVIINLSLAML